MFADRPDRSVGRFLAGCGNFVWQSPGGGKPWGKIARLLAMAGRPLPGRTTAEAELLVLALVGLGPGFGRRLDGRLAPVVHPDGAVWRRLLGRPPGERR